jgi:heat shock protein HtpX
MDMRIEDASIPPTPASLAIAAVLQYWPLVTGVAAVWLLLGYFFNGAMIRAATAARAVERGEAPKLYNLLENLCISRGLRTPRLYIIDGDEMNAFASGIDEKSYSITVTRGLVETLDNAELEAVLGHELTHIINRDVRLLIVTVVFTGMLSFIAQMLWRSLRFASYGRSRSRNQGNAAFVMMLVAAVMMAAGYMLALLLRLALSRRREYLADAGSVELTKNPEALISALRKISGHADVPHVPPEVQQLFIENPPSAFGLFDTHPPIEDRIRVLREIGGLPPAGESVIPETGG